MAKLWSCAGSRRGVMRVTGQFLKDRAAVDGKVFPAEQGSRGSHSASFLCCRVWMDVWVPHHGRCVPPGATVQSAHEFIRGGQF
jgi:hypothetical protein